MDTVSSFMQDKYEQSNPEIWRRFELGELACRPDKDDDDYEREDDNACPACGSAMGYDGMCTDDDCHYIDI